MAAGWDDRPKDEAAQNEDSFRLPRGSLELLGETPLKIVTNCV